MKIKSLLILMFLFSIKEVIAQTCTHKDLSKKFDFRITRTTVSPNDSLLLFGESEIFIEVYLKGGSKVFQKIKFNTKELYSNDFKDCLNDRSLITGKNKNGEVTDNNYGDIAVADFNFDGREDFAIKDRHIGNIGAGYHFYVQTDNGFKEDKYLTDQASFFPWLLDMKRHLFITTVSPMPGTTIRKYKYNLLTKSWHQVSKRFVWHDENLEYYLSQLKK